MQEALVGLFPDWLPSRKSCRKAIDRGDIWCQGQRAHTALRVHTGDQVEFRPQPVEAPDPGNGPAGPLTIVRPRGGEVAFVWKSAGVATSGQGVRHLAGILAHRAQHGSPAERQALQPLQPDGMPNPQPVHRLDRPTSGWVCTALTLKAAASLGRAFAEHSVRKRYLALASGAVENGGSNVTLDGKSAHTTWRVLGQGALPVHGDATLLEVRPTTGRTHQIRRHLAAAGHPLVGEDEHAAPGLDPATAPRFTGHGLFLCAIGLSIPEGDHGPAAEVTADVPRKYKRIRWAAEALARHGFT